MQQMLGYVRVSTKEQNLGRQLTAMRKMGIAPGNIYMDRLSGKDFSRPQYQKLMLLPRQKRIASMAISGRRLLISMVLVPRRLQKMMAVRLL